MTAKAFEILMAEDNPADVRLAQAAFQRSQCGSVLHVVKDGVDAMEFLQRKGCYGDSVRPNLIFLDLNLPRKDGREVLAEIKNDPQIRWIPVVVFTTSKAGRDIETCYGLHANCYIVKPADVDRYFKVISDTELYWLKTVTTTKP
jgi:CheY-like chemotaxis protein